MFFFFFHFHDYLALNVFHLNFLWAAIIIIVSLGKSNRSGLSTVFYWVIR